MGNVALCVCLSVHLSILLSVYRTVPWLIKDKCDNQVRLVQ